MDHVLLNGTMQNDQNVQVHHERLGNEPDSNSSALRGPTPQNGPSLRGPTQSGPSLPGPPQQQPHGSKSEDPFAMVLLPPIKNGRHSRPLAPPSERSRQPLPPGGARRIKMSSPKKVSAPPPMAPPRPEHTLTPNSRPIVTRNHPMPINSTTQNNNNLENNALSSSSTTSSTQQQSTVLLAPPMGPSSPAIPVMELVSLPTLVNNNVNTVSNQNVNVVNGRKVSLTSPRPEPERETNLYTEAPKKLLLPQKSHISVISQSNNQNRANQNSGDHVLAAQQTSTNSSKVSPSNFTSNLQLQKQKQLNGTSLEISQNFSTETNSIVADQISEQSSIFCQDCGKCKCEACCRPRKLPQKWLCGGTCLCSKTTVVDTLSCMCCVKGCFYHCTKDDLEETEIDSTFSNPCSCQGNHHTARWAAMATLWPFIPCLLTYPLLGACAKMTEVIYAKCTASGCQCQNHSNQQLNKSSADSLSADSSVLRRSGQLSLSAADHVKELAANVNNPSFTNKIIDAPPEKRLLITSSPPSSKLESLVPGSNSKLLSSSKPKLATTSLQSSTPNSPNTTATQIMRIKGGHFC